MLNNPIALCSIYPLKLSGPVGSSTSIYSNGMCPMVWLTRHSRRISPCLMLWLAELPLPQVGISIPCLFIIAVPTCRRKIEPRWLPPPAALPLIFPRCWRSRSRVWCFNPASDHGFQPLQPSTYRYPPWFLRIQKRSTLLGGANPFCHHIQAAF